MPPKRNDTDHEKLVDQIIDYFGGTDRICYLLNISKSAVHSWKIRGIPPLRAIYVERLSFGKFKAWDMLLSHQDHLDEKPSDVVARLETY